MANFNTYDLRDLRDSARGVYALADDLLPQMAEAFAFDLAPSPDVGNLRLFIGQVGPDKYLRDNIEQVQQRLGTNNDPTQIAADWVERSGVLQPMQRSFVTGEAIPEDVIDVAFMGGVARHMLRRAHTAEQYLDGKRGATLVVAAGAREMKVAEHELVQFYAEKHAGVPPTEVDFQERFIVPRFAGNLALLRPDGTERVYSRSVDSKAGRDVAQKLALTEEEINSGAPTLVVGNAPTAIESAAQYRRARGGDFDQGNRLGKDVFVLSDGIPVARHGEGPATHQNPLTALGAIVRSAMYLQGAVESMQRPN